MKKDEVQNITCLLQNKLENSINLMMMVYFSVYSFCSIKRSKCFENSFLNIRRKIPLRHDRGAFRTHSNIYDESFCEVS